MSQLKAIFDPLLTGVSSAYVPEGMISESVLPVVKAMQSSGSLAKYGTNHLRIEQNLKAGRGAYRRAEPITRTTASYIIEGHGLEGLVTDSDYRNAQAPFDAERDEVMGLTSLLWLEKENTLASTLLSTSVITQNTTLAAAAQYSDPLTSDPLADFSLARKTIVNGCGAIPNLAVMDWQVWNVLRFHPAMLDALGFKQSRPGGLSMDEMSVAMGVDRVLIAKARYESAKEGQTSSLGAIWGKDILFAVAPVQAVPMQVSLGYMVQYADRPSRQVYKYAVNNPPNSTGVLCEDNYDVLVSNSSAGYLIKSAIA